MPYRMQESNNHKKLNPGFMKSAYVFRHLLGTLIFFAVIFIAAGRLIYWQGLVYAALGLFMGVLNYTVLRIDHDLEKERAKPGHNTMKWDKVILILSFLATIAMYLIAGFDSGRYHWSPEFHWSLYGTGILLTGTGQLLFLIAQKQNRFFSSTVRIQTERGHTVCDTGLYKTVRHPAYLGSVIQALGFPLIFGSVFSWIPVILSLALIIIRTSLEDKTLKNELPGYREYASKTRFRLLPYIW
jgi:protein-S-isoprenylcysteine O-methyltransferase Ste14